MQRATHHIMRDNLIISRAYHIPTATALVGSLIKEKIQQMDLPSGWLKDISASSCKLRSPNWDVAITLKLPTLRVDVDKGRGIKIKTTSKTFERTDDVIDYMYSVIYDEYFRTLLDLQFRLKVAHDDDLELFYAVAAEDGQYCAS